MSRNNFNKCGLTLSSNRNIQQLGKGKKRGNHVLNGVNAKLEVTKIWFGGSNPQREMHKKIKKTGKKTTRDQEMGTIINK